MVLGWPVGATVGVRRLQALWRARRAARRRRAGAGGLARFPRSSTPDSSPIVAGLGSLVVGPRHGPLQQRFDHPDPGNRHWSERGSVTASYPVRPQPWQHVRRDRVRRRAQFRPPAIRATQARTSDQLRQLLERGVAKRRAIRGFARRSNSRFTSPSYRCSRSRSWCAATAVSGAEGLVRRRGARPPSEGIRPPPSPAFRRPRPRASSPGRTSPRANGTNRSRSRRFRTGHRRGQRAARARCR